MGGTNHKKTTAQQRSIAACNPCSCLVHAFESDDLRCCGFVPREDVSVWKLFRLLFPFGTAPVCFSRQTGFQEDPRIEPKQGCSSQLATHYRNTRVLGHPNARAKLVTAPLVQGSRVGFRRRHSLTCMPTLSWPLLLLPTTHPPRRSVVAGKSLTTKIEDPRRMRPCSRAAVHASKRLGLFCFAVLCCVLYFVTPISLPAFRLEFAPSNSSVVQIRGGTVKLASLRPVADHDWRGEPPESRATLPDTLPKKSNFTRPLHAHCRNRSEESHLAITSPNKSGTAVKQWY